MAERLPADGPAYSGGVDAAAADQRGGGGLSGPRIRTVMRFQEALLLTFRG